MPESIESLEQTLVRLQEEALREIAQASGKDQIEGIRVKYLGRKGILTRYFSKLGEEGWSRQEKSRLGSKLNAVKREFEQALKEWAQDSQKAQSQRGPSADLTLPGFQPSSGRIHPITRVIDEIVDLFHGLGFSVVEGPEIETERYNFEALNIPPEHPSRESFDTFYLKLPQRFLLRSHTSPVQIRFMERHSPPFQIVVPGRVFRPDAVDASHSFQFHQVEGLAVGPGISFSDLKGTLTLWARGMFGEKAELRFRPHYFPFTEPSAEVDLRCIFCLPAERLPDGQGQAGQGKGCRVCGYKGWLEILGCGMVHPAVFRSVGYLPETVGFAFGMGVERIAMLKYGIEDIRLFFENDLRFLKQFP